MRNYTDRRGNQRRIDGLSVNPSLISKLYHDIRYNRSWKAKLDLKRLEDERPGA